MPRVGQVGIDQATGRPVMWDGEQAVYLDPTPLSDAGGPGPSPIPNPAETYGTATEWTAKGLAQNAAADVLPTLRDTAVGTYRLLKNANPVSMGMHAQNAARAAPGVVRGLWQAGKNAAADPAGTLIDIGQGIYDRPVATAAMVSPAARLAGFKRVGQALDTPSNALTLASKAARPAARGWMAHVSKIDKTLKRENPGVNIAQFKVDEGISNSPRGMAKAQRIIDEETEAVSDLINRNPQLVERRGPAARTETPPLPPAGSHPLNATGTGSAVGAPGPGGAPLTREIPTQFAEPPLGVSRTGTGWTAPQSIPVRPGPVTQVTGTGASPSSLVPGAVAPEMPGIATPKPSVPAQGLNGPVVPGTEELRQYISGIEPISDVANQQRTAMQRVLDWVQEQAPNPLDERRYDQAKRGFQQRTTWGIKQRDMGDDVLANKKLGYGFRRVQNEVRPEVGPHNQRAGAGVAALEATKTATQRAENYNVIPARAMWGGMAATGLTGNPAFLGLALPYLIDHPYVGSLGAINLGRAGRTAGAMSRLPSAGPLAAGLVDEQQITEEALRRALLEQMEYPR